MIKKILIMYTLLILPSLAENEKDIVRLEKLQLQYTQISPVPDNVRERIDFNRDIQRLTSKIYGRKSAEYASACYELATLYEEKGRQSQRGQRNWKRDHNRALDLYEDYFKIIRNNDHTLDKEYLTRLIDFVYYEKLIKGYYTNSNHFEDALEIARTINFSEAEVAEIEIDYALNSLNRYDHKGAEKYMASAKERFQNVYGDNHFKYAESLLLYGVAYQFNSKSSASDIYEKALKLFDQFEQEDLTLKDETHKYLIDFYEKLGRSDKATYHCQALAQNYSLDPDQEIQPLYYIDPYFPRETPEQRAISRWSGLFELTIDTEGRTKDIQLVESSDDIYNEWVVQAISKFRYAPEILNGELVEKTGVKIPIRQFWISRSSN